MEQNALSKICPLTKKQCYREKCTFWMTVTIGDSNVDNCGLKLLTAYLWVHRGRKMK